MRKNLILVCTVFLVANFSAGSIQDPEKAHFRQYWYQQKAELTRYSLDQARYGEIRKGESVLIFVTEPFFKDKQVKFFKLAENTHLWVTKAESEMNVTRQGKTVHVKMTAIRSHRPDIDGRRCQAPQRPPAESR